MSIHCKVIEDLLPSYVDGLTSTESNQLIEEHIEGCTHCKEMLSDLQKEAVVGIKNKEVSVPQEPAKNLVTL